MDIYAFANQKGGVGKTTVTLGVAASLARQGVHALLVDLDPQASATKVLGVDLNGRVTVADAMLEPERFCLTQAIVKSGFQHDGARGDRPALSTGIASRRRARWTVSVLPADVMRDRALAVFRLDGEKLRGGTSACPSEGLKRPEKARASV